MHLWRIERARARKAPTYKAKKFAQIGQVFVQNLITVWKSRLFSGKLGLLTRPASEDRSENADGSAMALSSPLRRWSIERNGRNRHPVSPEIRAAVERRLAAIQQDLFSADKDESAAEVMERAVERTAHHFADRPPVDSAEADRILARFWDLEVRRLERQREQFEFANTSVESQGHADAKFAAIDAALDVDKILKSAPPAVRQALMMRYGGLEEWNEIATLTGTTAEGIRKSCQRYLGRLRAKLGIRGGS
jgi:DNA-directed RNA polymerase specialized sigma24 family protein